MQAIKPRRISQTGLGLIEAVVALLVLSLGLLACVRLQSWLRTNSDTARERSEAVHHAQQDLERLRLVDDLVAFDRQALHTARSEDGMTTVYRLERSLVDQDGLRTGHTSVRWSPRSGDEQVLQLVSSVARQSPVYSAALSLPPQDVVFAMRQALPFGAGVLSAGRGVVRPLQQGALVWIIDTASGEIVAQCNAASTTPTRRLRTEDLSRCESFTARLVQGHVRFSLGTTPDASAPNDAPLALSVWAGETRCFSESGGTGGERYIAYACAVLRDTQGPLPPRLEPQGWSLGLTADRYKVCRYPQTSLRDPLNFLVVRGDVACPALAEPLSPVAPLTPQTPHNGDPVTTVPHQP
jgi:hypothetical protein